MFKTQLTDQSIWSVLILKHNEICIRWNNIRFMHTNLEVSILYVLSACPHYVLNRFNTIRWHTITPSERQNDKNINILQVTLFLIPWYYHSRLVLKKNINIIKYWYACHYICSSIIINISQEKRSLNAYFESHRNHRTRLFTLVRQKCRVRAYSQSCRFIVPLKPILRNLRILINAESRVLSGVSLSNGIQ